jgi:hypothetical protein
VKDGLNVITIFDPMLEKDGKRERNGHMVVVKHPHMLYQLICSTWRRYSAASRLHKVAEQSNSKRWWHYSTLKVTNHNS